MRRASSLVLASLALPLAYINAQSIVAVDPNGQLCSPTQTVCYRTAQFGPSSLGLVSVTCPVTSVIGGQPLTSGQSSMKGPSSTNGLSLTTGQPSINTRSATTSATVSATLTLGAGLPSGTVYNLPNSPILLAYMINIPGLQPRQAGSARAPIVGYASGSGFEGSSTSDCAYATRFSLINGTLQNMAGEFLGKNSTMDALISPWPYFNTITTLFSFVDGLLVWNSPDQGKAKFYRCGGVPLYAVFPNSPPTSCLPIIIGGVSDSACGVDLLNTASTANSSISATTTQATSSTLPPFSNTTLSGSSITTSSTDSAVGSSTSSSITNTTCEASATVCVTSRSTGSSTITGSNSTMTAASSAEITTSETVSSSSSTTSTSLSDTSTSSSNLTSSLDIFSTISSIVSSFNISTSLSDTSTSQSTITTGLNITVTPTITVTPPYLNTTISSTSSTITTLYNTTSTSSTDLNSPVITISVSTTV